MLSHSRIRPSLYQPLQPDTYFNVGSKEKTYSLWHMPSYFPKQEMPVMGFSAGLKSLHTASLSVLVILETPGVPAAWFLFICCLSDWFTPRVAVPTTRSSTPQRSPWKTMYVNSGREVSFSFLPLSYFTFFLFSFFPLFFPFSLYSYQYYELNHENYCYHVNRMGCGSSLECPSKWFIAWPWGSHQCQPLPSAQCVPVFCPEQPLPGIMAT